MIAAPVLAPGTHVAGPSKELPRPRWEPGPPRRRAAFAAGLALGLRGAGRLGRRATEEWRGYEIRCSTCRGDDSKPHVVLVHGFGGSIDYWRRLVPALQGEGYTVHAFDLLGLGLSEKPAVTYSIELWAEQVTDFVAKLGKDVVLVGNSFGSLISLAAAKEVKPLGIVMVNCAVGMNNKNMLKSPKMNDLQRMVASSVLGLVDLIFRSPVLDFLFANFATRDQVASVLKNLYPTNPSAVDAELAEGFVKPAETEGALAVLRQIYTGEAGPTPMELFRAHGFEDLPLKVIWGDQDTLTPITGDVGSFLLELAQERGNVDFEVVSGGHLPHDENPKAVNEAVLAWLARGPWR